MADEASVLTQLRALLAKATAEFQSYETTLRMPDHVVFSTFGTLRLTGGEIRGLLPALSALLDVVEAARPFGSGSDWGKVKAWICEGAPDRETGIQYAKALTGLQVALDAALGSLERAALGAPPAPGEGGRHDGLA